MQGVLGLLRVFEKAAKYRIKPSEITST